MRPVPSPPARTGPPGSSTGAVSAARPGRSPDLRLAAVAAGTWLSALIGLHAATAVTVGLALCAAVTAALVVALPAAAAAATRRAGRGAGVLPVGRGAGVLPVGRGAGALPVGRGGWAPWSLVGLLRARARMASPGWRWVGVAALLGVVCGGTATAARTVVRDAEPLAGLAERGATVRARLVVRDDPRRVGRGGRAVLLVPADLHGVEPDGRDGVRLDARVLVLSEDRGWAGLLPGQRVVTRGRLAPARGGDLRAAVLSAGAPETVGRPGWLQRVAGDLRAGLRLACDPLPDEPGGLLPGLVVGDTSALDQGVADDFRATGLTHLVAVSGTNVAIVLGAVLLLTRWARAGPRAASMACAFALVGFVVLARPSPSVVRAGAMGAVGILALASGRSRAAVPALGAAVVALVVWDPELAGHPGFALSVLATGGLLLLAPRWRDALRSRGVPAGIAEALAVPAAAQVACGPLVAALSGTVSAVAVPANLLAVPAVAPATVLGVGAAALSPVWPSGAEFLAWLAGWPAWWLVTIARYGADVPAGTLPWPAGVTGGLLLALVTGAALVAGRWRVARRLAAVVTVAALLGALPVRLLSGGWPPTGWVVVACAVGQGDAVVLRAGPGSAVVVDAGPEPAPIDRCLRRLGVRRIPMLVVSHFHADHVGGVAGVFRGRRVDVVLVPTWPEPLAGRAEVAAAAARARAPLRPAVAGSTFGGADLRMTVVGPARAVRGTRSDPNNNSVVLRAVVRGVSVLLPGDAEGEEQQALLGRVDAAGLRAAVLKLAHHGSAYQDPEFLTAVDPAVVLVSVGADNRYGHPNPALLSRLSRDGARVLRTDVDGDVAAVRTPTGVAVAVRGREPGRPGV